MIELNVKYNNKTIFSETFGLLKSKVSPEDLLNVPEDKIKEFLEKVKRGQDPEVHTAKMNLLIYGIIERVKLGQKPIMTIKPSDIERIEFGAYETVSLDGLYDIVKRVTGVDVYRVKPENLLVYLCERFPTLLRVIEK